MACVSVKLACTYLYIVEVTIIHYIGISEASETLSEVTNGNRRYIIYIWYVRPHFSTMVPGLCNVGGVKCQPFL